MTENEKTIYDCDVDKSVTELNEKVQHFKSVADSVASSYTHVNDEYNASIDLIDVKLTLENCSENYITLNFGNNRSVVVIRNNIYNVIPEVMEQ